MVEKYTNGAWAELAGYKKYGKTEFDLSSFPASFQSEGVNMSDYRIYGANGGVGEQTENLFDTSTATMATYWIDDDTNTFTYSETSRCYFIPASANVTYTVTDFTDILPPGRFVFRVAFTNAIPTSHAANVGTTYLRQRVNSTGGDKHFATITNQNYNYLAIQVRTTEPNDIMLTEGSTTPAQYIPYGYQINAVVSSENLFDETTVTSNYSISSDGVITQNVNYYISDYIPVQAGTYRLRCMNRYTGAGAIHKRAAFYNANHEYVQMLLNYEGANLPVEIDSAFIVPNTGYIRLSLRITDTDVSLARYSNTPIYIGDTPLAQGEYVDYGEQKVYKYVGGVLTPTDPPVALPALPTIDGVTMVDFDNTPKPSHMTGEAIGWRTMTPKIYENGAWT